MVINPQNDCTWTFQNGILSINLTTDEGKSYLFKTHFSVDDLYMKPEVNASFTIKEGELLTYYLEGINKILRMRVVPLILESMLLLVNSIQSRLYLLLDTLLWVHRESMKYSKVM